MEIASIITCQVRNVYKTRDGLSVYGLFSFDTVYPTPFVKKNQSLTLILSCRNEPYDKRCWSSWWSELFPGSECEPTPLRALIWSRDALTVKLRREFQRETYGTSETTHERFHGKFEFEVDRE